MNREKQLVKNTVIITIGKICTQMISFFLLPLYTSILTTEEYGVVDLLNTLVSLFIPIVTFQIEQAVFRYLIDARNDEEKTAKVVSTTVFTVILQCILYLGIFMIVSRWINNEYKYFLATNVVACIGSSIMLQISRGLGDNQTYAIGSFITAGVMIIFNVIFIVGFRFGAYGMLTASLLSNIICIIFIFFRKKIYKYLRIKDYEKDLLKKLWGYSLPLIPNSLSWWVFNSSDRLLVSYFLGMGANGIFAAAHKFSSVYITIYNIFNMTWTESATLHINDEDNSEFFSKITNNMFSLFSCICFGIIAFMPFVFPIMINNAYGDAYFQIPILMLASLGNVGVGLISVVYIAKKKTKEVAKISIMAAVINIIVHLTLIKFVGLYAASISTFVAYYSMLIYRLIDVRKYVKLSIDKKMVLRTFTMAVILLITYYLNNFALNIIMVLVTILYSIIVNGKNITVILNFVKTKIGRLRANAK